MKKVECMGKQDLKIRDKRALVVDDDMEKGETMTVVLEALSEAVPADIRTAVLSPNDQQTRLTFYPLRLYDLSSGVQRKKSAYGSQLRFKWLWEPISPYRDQFAEKTG